MTSEVSSIFFTCQATPASCASGEVASFLKRCGQYDEIAFNERDNSACCDSPFGKLGKVRECVYFRPTDWTARRISIYPVANQSTKPKYELRNWGVYNSVVQVDITRVTVLAIDNLSFDYNVMRKLSVVDADLQSLQTPPASSLTIIDLTNNLLKDFPLYLFNDNQAVLDQLNIYGNPWQPSINLDSTQCSRLKSAADTGHLTGMPMSCSCSGTSSLCTLPLLTTNQPLTTASNVTTPQPVQPTARSTTITPTTTTMAPEQFNNTTQPSTELNVQKIDDGSSTGTILVIAMAITVVGLAFVAIFMYRRRRNIQRNPNAVTGFEMVVGSSRPFTRPLILSSGSKTQLLRKTSSSVSVAMKTGPIRHRVDQLPILPSEQVKLLHLISGNLFTGKYNGENVVMKRLDAREVNEEEVTNFISDVNFIGQLEHPSVLTLYGVVRFGDYEVCAVAEFMKCGSLPHLLLKEDIALSWPDQLRMSFEVASALAYVHSQPNYTRAKCFTSRDVLVNMSLTCKLNIFDFMKHYKQTQGAEYTYGGSSLAWEAPEVISHNCSRSSTAEIYALGVILGEIVTRAKPYQSWVQDLGHVGSDIKIMERCARKSRDMPHENRTEFASCPRFFRNLVSACLERDVLRRPLAVSVAETLYNEMTLLKKNFG